MRPKPSSIPIPEPAHSSDDLRLNLPSPPYKAFPSTSQLHLDAHPSPAYLDRDPMDEHDDEKVASSSSHGLDGFNESTLIATVAAEEDTERPNIGTRVHYPSDVHEPSPAPGYIAPKLESRVPSQSVGGETDEEHDEQDGENYDWSGEEDMEKEEEEFEKKMGVKPPRKGWSLWRVFKLLFSTLIGSTLLAGIIACPAILLHFFWYQNHPERAWVMHNIEAWCYWAAANVLTSWYLAFIVDLNPSLVRFAIAAGWGHVSERVKSRIELYDSVKDTLKPLLYAASAWVSWIIIFVNIYKLHDTSAGVTSRAAYTDRVSETVEFGFFLVLVICAQQMLSHAIAFAFHRTAYQDRITTVRETLSAIETLRDYKPKTHTPPTPTAKNKRHSKNGSKTGSSGVLTPFLGLGGTHFDEKEHFQYLSGALRSAAPYGDEHDHAGDADVEDGGGPSPKGKENEDERARRARRRSRNMSPTERDEKRRSHNMSPTERDEKRRSHNMSPSERDEKRRSRNMSPAERDERAEKRRSRNLAVPPPPPVRHDTFSTDMSKSEASSRPDTPAGLAMHSQARGESDSPHRYPPSPPQAQGEREKLHRDSEHRDRAHKAKEREERETALHHAALVLKAAVLHDARNIRGKDSGLKALAWNVNSAHEAKRLAKSIYYRFKDRRRTYLLASDFYPAFATTAEAEAAFRVFDKDGNGDISRGEIKGTLLKVYKERRFLSRSMRDVGIALKTLDQILLFFAFVILFFISLSVFGVNVASSLTSVYSLGIGASFIFKNAASNAFDAIMFLFVTHPFDTGDRVFIDDENFVVKKMGLFATVFTRADGTETYYFNSLLFTKFITNVRRSGKMFENLTMQVAWKTPIEKLDQLEVLINEWLQTEENRWFETSTSLTFQTIDFQRHLTITMAFGHNGTWQDWGLRNARKTAFHAAVQYYCRELDIDAREAPVPWAFVDHDTHEVPDSPGYDAQSPSGESLPDLGLDAAQQAQAEADAVADSKAAMRNVLGFTPPEDRTGTQITRARKSRSRKTALRSMGADGF